MKREVCCYRYLVSAIILVIALMMLIVPAPAMADDSPTAKLRMVAASAEVPAPTGTFDVEIHGPCNIFTAGFQIWLHYDSTYVEPSGVVAGVPFPGTADPDQPTLSWPIWTADGDYMFIGGTVLLDAGAQSAQWIDPNTSVHLCTVTFETKAATPPECTEIVFVTQGMPNSMIDAQHTMLTGSPDPTDAHSETDVPLGADDTMGVKVCIPESNPGGSIEIIFNPMIYDVNGSDVIDYDEAVDAIQEYFAGEISYDQVVDVIQLYFAG